MKRSFIEMPLFSKRWKELGLSDDELFELQDYLLKYPDAGVLILNYSPRSGDCS